MQWNGGRVSSVSGSSVSEVLSIGLGRSAGVVSLWLFGRLQEVNIELNIVMHNMELMIFFFIAVFLINTY